MHRLTNLETERLVGEPVEERHRAAAIELFGDPRVAAWIWPGEFDGPRSEAQADEILERFRAHWADHGFGWWWLRERATDELVGEVGLQWTTIEGAAMVEVGWTLFPRSWGHGFATEGARAALEFGFEGAGLESIVALTLEENHASRRVMERLAMVFERPCIHAGFPHVLYRCERQPPPIAV